MNSFKPPDVEHPVKYNMNQRNKMAGNVLILECGKGFGGALTSLKAFVDQVDASSGIKFHLLTSYRQDLIQKGGSVCATKVVPRHRLYGPESRLEKGLGRLLPKGAAGHVAFVLDLLFSGWVYAARIIWYIRKNKIDLVHLNNSILINDYGIIAGFLARKKVIVQVRAPEYPSKIARALALMADHFLPVSSFVAASLTALKIPPSAVSMVPEGLDAAHFVQLAARRPSFDMTVPGNCVVIGMVGCLVPWKGHGVFLEACARVLQKHRVMVYIAGDTPDGDAGYKNELQDQARALGISGEVHFLGHCANVAPVINACDIMVHASTAPEPFGRVLLEAMALGRPMVATDAGGPAEVIDHEVDGILVPLGDPEAMARAILTLISDEELRSRMGLTAAQKVRMVYSIEQHVRMILHAYDR